MGLIVGDLWGGCEDLETNFVWIESRYLNWFSRNQSVFNYHKKKKCVVFVCFNPY